jgi:hypothetical protein
MMSRGQNWVSRSTVWDSISRDAEIRVDKGVLGGSREFNT